MTKIQVVFALIATMIILTGCAGNRELIKTMSTSIRQDVFQEVAEKTSPEPGYVDLRIYSSLKTHRPGIYSKKDVHGTPNYMMFVNIDGQAIQLQGNLQNENFEPREFRDPEAGNGIRYRFSKNLRLKAGTHKIIVAFPDDEIAIEREITLSDKSNNRLVVEPIYGAVAIRQRPAFYGVTSFKEGLKRLRLILNGRDI